MLQVLVDADNLSPARLRSTLDALPPDGVRMTVAGHPAALRRVRWPAHATVVPAQGWQRADVVLATAYRPDDEPLVLVSGDGDFTQLAARHPGPVLVVSGAPSAALRDVASVVDIVHDGLDRMRQWLRAV